MEHPAADDEGLLYSLDGAVTAGEARAAARALASVLVDAGVRPHDVVAVRLPSGPDSVVAMTAVWLAGAIFVPINATAPAREVTSSLETAGAVVLVEPGNPFAVRVLSPSAVPSYPADAALIMWTSGTTGPPKPIVHNRGAYLAVIDRVLGPLRGARANGADGTSRRPSPNLIPVSMALNSGVFNALFGLRAGAPLVIMKRFAVDDFAELVSRFGIRSSVLPPAAIVMLNDSALTDLAPLRYVRSITAPLSPVQARRFIDRFGVFVLNGYGQAELGEVIGWTGADARDHADKIGAAGRPHPGVSVRVVATGGEEVTPGEVGSLRVRTASIDEAAAASPDLRARLDASGHLDTGDLARVDDEGFVWIEGRAGNLINRGGNKIFPEQVEEILQMLPMVAEAAVIGRPDERLGEVPVAFVVDADGVPPAADDDLEAHCREHLVAYKVPVAFRRVVALPRTESGKVRRGALLTSSGP